MVLQLSSGQDKAIFDKYKSLKAIRLFMAMKFFSFVAEDKPAASILHPDFSTLKYSSIFHLSLYQFIRSIASSKLFCGNVGK